MALPYAMGIYFLQNKYNNMIVKFCMAHFWDKEFRDYVILSHLGLSRKLGGKYAWRMGIQIC